MVSRLTRGHKVTDWHTRQALQGILAQAVPSSVALRLRRHKVKIIIVLLVDV